MLYTSGGAYASLFQTLLKYHFGESLKPRIKVEVIYGSEGGQSYELAKEFVTELIKLFKHMDFLVKEIQKRAKKNEYNIKYLEKETKQYLKIYMKHQRSFLKRTQKIGAEECNEGYEEKKSKEKKNNEIKKKIGQNKNDKGEPLSPRKKVNKKREMKKKGNDTEFALYDNYELKTDKVSLILGFKCGNDFQSDRFCENSKEYELNLLFFFISTYSGGSFPKNALELENELTRIEIDFVKKETIENIFYSCVGLGNKEYGNEDFCKPIEKCDHVCSTLMNRFNKTIKLCETENVEELFFEWKIETIKILFLSLYIYYFYNGFVQTHTIFTMSPWNKPIRLNKCCRLFSYNSFTDKKLTNGYHIDRNLTDKKNKCKTSKDVVNYTSVEEETGCFEIPPDKKGSEEKMKKIKGAIGKSRHENCSNSHPCHCQTEMMSGMTTDVTIETTERCVERWKESPTDRAADENDSIEDETEEEMEEEIEEIEGESFEDDMEDLLQENKNKEMLTNNQREKLKKEGYKIIGSHSAVKLCRWTKSQLRGRGGCYKNSFYGINSYQCMETTPSLACANKCVFCWRHHKNPVGKEWNWKMDDPEFIVKEGIEKHRKMIKELKGMHGVIPERYEEAFNIKHCALSLVGEPIMYPKINNLIDELHSHHISTFLVTNAQFPEALKNLKQVTQLYLSIDASNEERLKNIDRPLFKDFWNRYIECIKILKNRKERTVFRFTLVKEYNMMLDEMEGYSKLVELGFPDFIEIKAATYCGSSNGYALTMKNIPWYEEVCLFATKLINETFFLRNNYELTCQHKHSCSVLIAKKKFKINQKWHTWIDYEKFHFLVKTNKHFDALDYCAQTPEWALCGAKEEGFNPMDTRVYKKGKYKQTEVC